MLPTSPARARRRAIISAARARRRAILRAARGTRITLRMHVKWLTKMRQMMRTAKMTLMSQRMPTMNKRMHSTITKMQISKRTGK